MDFTGPTRLFGLIKKTEVPFCSFSQKVNFWGYMKITYVFNSSSNPANVELSSSKKFDNIGLFNGHPNVGIRITNRRNVIIGMVVLC